VLLEALVYRAVIRHGRGRLINDDDIESRQQRLMVPKGFSNHSLYTVSRACLATVLLRDRHSKPANLLFVVAAKYCKEFIAVACGFFEHAAESGGIE
jgi:hypothetical protein